MKILLITFVLVLTSLVGCSSKSTKDNSSTHVPSPNLLPPKDVPLPNNSNPTDSKSATSPNKSMKALECKRNSETRSLSIEEVSPKGCQLIYSHFNPKKPIAWSSKGLNHCESVLERIKGKLEAAQFKCQ